MKKKMLMDADELEVGMLVHPPHWNTAPDAFTRIISLEQERKVPGGLATTVKITAENSDPWTVPADEMIEVRSS